MLVKWWPSSAAIFTFFGETGWDIHPEKVSGPATLMKLLEDSDLKPVGTRLFPLKRKASYGKPSFPVLERAHLYLGIQSFVLGSLSWGWDMRPDKYGTGGVYTESKHPWFGDEAVSSAKKSTIWVASLDILLSLSRNSVSNCKILDDSVLISHTSGQTRA